MSQKHEGRARCCAEAEVLAEADLPSLNWVPAAEQRVIDFLVGEENFSEERVRKIPMHHPMLTFCLRRG